MLQPELDPTHNKDIQRTQYPRIRPKLFWLGQRQLGRKEATPWEGGEGLDRRTEEGIKGSTLIRRGGKIIIVD